MRERNKYIIASTRAVLQMYKRHYGHTAPTFLVTMRSRVLSAGLNHRYTLRTRDCRLGIIDGCPWPVPSLLNRPKRLIKGERSSGRVLLRCVPHKYVVTRIVVKHRSGKGI